MVIVLAGILSAVAIPKIATIAESSRAAATREEMQRLKRGIVGDPELASGGRASSRGYAGDVGAVPPDLAALVARPAGVSSWNPYTRSGWHGPYVDPTGGDYLTDAWGAGYQYDPVARTITSIGSGSALVLGF